MHVKDFAEAMKNLPARFSNLTFWRECRKLKDSVVDALEYLNFWGIGIENLLNELKAHVDYFNNTTAEPVQSGRLWASTENGAGWAKPGFKLIQSTVIQNTDDINKFVVDLSDYKYHIIYVFIKLPTGAYDRCMVSITFEGSQVYQYYPYIGNKSEDFCFYTLVGYDGDAPIALGTENNNIVYSPKWLKNFNSGNKLALYLMVSMSASANFPAGMEIYIYGKE